MSKTQLPPTDQRQIGQVTKQVQVQETVTPDSYCINGPRSDLPSGWGPRVRIGLLSDSSYGIERYTSTGVRQTTTWS